MACPSDYSSSPGPRMTMSCCGSAPGQKACWDACRLRRSDDALSREGCAGLRPAGHDLFVAGHDAERERLLHAAAVRMRRGHTLSGGDDVVVHLEAVERRLFHTAI